MNNTIIQEKVKEFDDWIDFSKAGHPGYKKLTPENYRAFLTEALTSLVKEVREEEIEKFKDLAISCGGFNHKGKDYMIKKSGLPDQ